MSLQKKEVLHRRFTVVHVNITSGNNGFAQIYK